MHIWTLSIYPHGMPVSRSARCVTMRTAIGVTLIWRSILSDVEQRNHTNDTPSVMTAKFFKSSAEDSDTRMRWIAGTG